MRLYPAISTAGLLLAVLTGCAHGPPTAPAPGPAAPLAASPPAATPSAAPAPTPQTAVPAATAPAPAASGTPAAASTHEAAPRTSPRPSARPRAPATVPAAATAPPAAAAPAAKPAAPALDLPALEQRLRDTHAIGVFTKLSLKNQVDDLLAEFRDYYGGRAQITLAELRRSYELLLMKVVTLLQNEDPTLAAAVSASREAIWAMLSDRKSFANL